MGGLFVGLHFFVGSPKFVLHLTAFHHQPRRRNTHEAISLHDQGMRLLKHTRAKQLTNCTYIWCGVTAVSEQHQGFDARIHRTALLRNLIKMTNPLAALNRR